MQTRQPAHGLGPTKALGGSIWQGMTGGYPWPSLSSVPGLRPGSTPHTCLSFVVQLHAKLTPNFSKLINFWKPGGISGWSWGAAGAKVARRTGSPLPFSHHFVFCLGKCGGASSWGYCPLPSRNGEHCVREASCLWAAQAG